MDFPKKIVNKKVIFYLLGLLILFISYFYLSGKLEFKSQVLSNDSEPIGEILNGNSVRQEVYIEDRNIKGIAIQFATYARENTSNLHIEIKNGSKVLLEKDINAKEIVDNQYLELKWIEEIKSEYITIIISSKDAVSGNAVTVWSSSQVANNDKLYINEVLVDKNLNLLLAQSKYTSLEIVGFLILISIIYIFTIIIMYLTLRGADSKCAKLLIFVYLFIVGVIVMYFRNANPLHVPILYAEDGVWVGKLLYLDFLEVALGARIEFPVFGLILLLKIGVLISEFLFDKDLSYLPIIYAIISYSFVSIFATISYFILKRYSVILSLISFFTILLIPVGGDGNEIYGRILNLGFLFPVISVILLVWRLNQKKYNFKVLLVDMFNLISCLTLPVGYGIVGIFLLVELLKVFSKGFKNNFITSLKRNTLQILTLLTSLFFVSGFINSKGGGEGLEVVKSNLIEFAVGRVFVYPFTALIWSKLNDTLVLILFILILAIIVASLLKIKNNIMNYSWYILLIGSVFVYWVALIIPRMELSAIFNNYSVTFPDRYFYGLNILIVITVFAAIFILIENVKQKIKIVILLFIMFSYLSNPNVFEYKNPAMKWDYMGDLRESFNTQIDNNSLDNNGNFNVEIYPEGWKMEVPEEYFRAILKDDI